MNRPVVTLGDLIQAEGVAGEQRKLIGVSNDLFIERSNHNSTWAKIALYRYKWPTKQAGEQIAKLGEYSVTQSFTIINATDCIDRLAMQLAEGRIWLFRFDDSLGTMSLLDSIEIDPKQVGGLMQLRQVIDSQSLVYLQCSTKVYLYHIDPRFRKIKHISTVNGFYTNLKLRDGLLFDVGFDVSATSNASNGIEDLSRVMKQTRFTRAGEEDLTDAISRYIGVDRSAKVVPMSSGDPRFTTLPGGEKIVLIYHRLYSGLYRLFLLRAQLTAQLRHLTCSTVLTGIKTRSHYCPHSGLQYFINAGYLGCVNVETLEFRMCGKHVNHSDHMWLPCPTRLDLYRKYVPILEASTNLPSDLCRLVASYLDW